MTRYTTEAISAITQVHAKAARLRRMARRRAGERRRPAGINPGPRPRGGQGPGRRIWSGSSCTAWWAMATSFWPITRKGRDGRQRGPCNRRTRTWRSAGGASAHGPDGVATSATPARSSAARDPRAVLDAMRDPRGLDRRGFRRRTTGRTARTRGGRAESRSGGGPEGSGRAPSVVTRASSEPRPATRPYRQ